MNSSKKEFIAEAEELLNESRGLILEIQETCITGINPDTINALFRSMHTLKGVSGLFGLDEITQLSHALETLMDDIRLGKIEINDSVISFLFRNHDVLVKLVDLLHQDKTEDVSGYLKDIESFRTQKEGDEKRVGAAESIDTSIRKVLSEYEEHRLNANIQSGKGIYLAKLIFGMDTFDTALEAVTKVIKTRGELISTLPTSSDVPEGSIGFNLMFSSALAFEDIKQDIEGDIDILLQPKKNECVPSPSQEQHEVGLKSTSTTVRVDIDKLDRILNTIAELSLAKSAVKRIGYELIETYGHTSLVYDVYKISQTLERRFVELQDQVLEIRMVPIGQIFSRLGQIVRRYAKEIGKQINLVMYGEDTELDKFLAEEIVDPLMHIIRNAIDHGIETPDERKKKGKEESGTIILKAYQKGNHVIVEIGDDGKGIDVERVRNKAIEKKLIDDDVELDKKEIIDFIFMPGFSTKQKVSEVSGRGVGMDVVKEKLSELGGFADLDTQKDVGTTFMVTIPITLAILKALIIRVGQEKFALPLTSMLETFTIDRKDIQTIEDKEVYYLRGDMLPIMRVSDAFNLKNDASEQSFAVVVGFGERRVGLLVDELFGQYEIVIKSLGEYLTKLRGFAGAAEIGKHEIILVLDVESLIGESLAQQKGGTYV
ncbi:MAG: chemotaxis protein CheA [Nitrospiraceae bacterium]|nr:MAG: chemotaxis protein CheA [Nitrospiraceae bacterium]